MDERRRVGAGEMSGPLYVCVYVPEFPAQVLLRLRPDLARSAVAIVEGDPPLQSVCSVNAQATRMGIAQGMTRAELEAFGGVCVLRRSAEEERSARAALLEAAGAFTPRIEVRPLLPQAFAMVLDMTGTTRVFGPAPLMAGSLIQAFSELRFFVQAAASSNFHAAVCMAPAARKGPIVIPAGKEREALGGLPLAAVGLGAQQAETLALWGLHTLGELAALPEVELVVRLGQEGKRLRALARGEHPHLMVPEEPVFGLQERMELDAPVELLDSLLFLVGPMLDQLLTRAQNRALALASVTIRLQLDGGGEYERTIKPALPVAQREVLLKLIHLDLQAHPPSAGVLSLLVTAEPGNRSKLQLGLFAPQLPEPMRLDVTLARISALVGEGRAGRARLLDSHRTDSFRMERFSVPLTPPKGHAGTKHAVGLRRCRPPLRISVQQQGPRPTHFSLQGKCYTAQEVYGPWRSSGSWWTNDLWSREEWDVYAKAAAEDTLLCVITHDLLRRQWQIEALYD